MKELIPRSGPSGSTLIHKKIKKKSNQIWYHPPPPSKASRSNSAKEVAAQKTDFINPVKLCLEIDKVIGTKPAPYGLPFPFPNHFVR